MSLPACCLRVCLSRYFSFLCAFLSFLCCLFSSRCFFVVCLGVFLGVPSCSYVFSIVCVFLGVFLSFTLVSMFLCLYFLRRSFVVCVHSITLLFVTFPFQLLISVGCVCPPGYFSVVCALSGVPLILCRLLCVSRAVPLLSVFRIVSFVNFAILMLQSQYC